MKPVTLDKAADALLITGAAEPAMGYLADQTLARFAAPVAVLLAHDTRTLDAWCDALSFFAEHAGDEPPHIERLPELGDLADDDARAFELRCDMIAALTALSHAKDPEQPVLLATTPAGLLQDCPHPSDLVRGQVTLKPGQAVSLTGFADQLAKELGYDSEAVCETPGQFAVRGGLIDVYPLNAEAPHRIDFFGDEVESIRAYDPTTQRSGDEVETLIITAAGAGLEAKRKAMALDYLPESVLWLLRQPAVIEERFSELFQVPENIAAPSRSFATVLKRRAAMADAWVGLADIDADQTFFPPEATRQPVESESLENYRTFADADKLGILRQEAGQSSRTAFLKQLAKWQSEEFQIYCVCKN
ncbi:MAG: hypothetical protein AAGA45_05020, partial [Verrucomicrobiota bacterium]